MLNLKSIRKKTIPRLFLRHPLLLSMFRRMIAPGKRIAVFGGHGGSGFDDNSRAMALHLARDPGYKVYWVAVTQGALDAAKEAGLRPLRRETYLSDAIVAAAHEVYYSHAMSDLTTCGYAAYPWRKVIYLGHGVWGFKRIERRSGSEPPKCFDFSICVSDAERSLKAEVLGVDIERILPVGIPKHDAMQNVTAEPVPGRRTVLYAPTWRDWLQHKPSDIAMAKHFGALERLVLQMPKTDSEGNEIELIYAVHKNIRSLSKRATEICEQHGVQCIQTGDVDVNDLLRNVDYLISDYSAMFWDFIVQGKPAVRFVFDREIYSVLTGSYPLIEARAGDLAFSDVEQVWAQLFNPETRAKVERIAQTVMPFSDGRSCEKLALAIHTSSLE